MLDKLKDTIVDGLVQKLNTKGIHVDAQTLKDAISNSPIVIQKIEEIYSSNLSNQEKFAQITTLLQKAAKGEFTQ